MGVRESNYTDEMARAKGKEVEKVQVCPQNSSRHRKLVWLVRNETRKLDTDQGVMRLECQSSRLYSVYNEYIDSWAHSPSSLSPPSPSMSFSQVFCLCPLFSPIPSPSPHYLQPFLYPTTSVSLSRISSLARPSCHTLLLFSFSRSYSLGMAVLLDVLLPVVPCPLTSCLRPLALTQDPLLLLPLLLVSHNHSPSLCVLALFFPTTASRSLQGWEDGTLFLDTWPKGKNFFFPFPCSFKLNNPMEGLWLANTGLYVYPCLDLSCWSGVWALIVAWFPFHAGACGWQPFPKHRKIGTNIGQKRNNWCSLCDYYSSILHMRKLRSKILNEFQSHNHPNLNWFQTHFLISVWCPQF